MAKKPAAKRKTKLTDKERHKRFVDMAKEVGASGRKEDFERAMQVIRTPASTKLSKS